MRKAANILFSKNLDFISATREIYILFDVAPLLENCFQKYFGRVITNASTLDPVLFVVPKLMSSGGIICGIIFSYVCYNLRTRSRCQPMSPDLRTGRSPNKSRPAVTSQNSAQQPDNCNMVTWSVLKESNTHIAKRALEASTDARTL